MSTKNKEHIFIIGVENRGEEVANLLRKNGIRITDAADKIYADSNMVMYNDNGRINYFDKNKNKTLFISLKNNWTELKLSKHYEDKDLDSIYSKLLEKNKEIKNIEDNLKNEIIKYFIFNDYEKIANSESLATGKIWQYNEKEYLKSLSIGYTKDDGYYLADCYCNNFSLEKILSILKNKNTITFQEFFSKAKY